MKDIVHTVTYLTRIPQNDYMCWIAESYDLVLHPVIPKLSRNITSHLFFNIFARFIYLLNSVLADIRDEVILKNCHFTLFHNEPYNLHILYTHLDETMATEKTSIHGSHEMEC